MPSWVANSGGQVGCVDMKETTFFTGAHGSQSLPVQEPSMWRSTAAANSFPAFSIGRRSHPLSVVQRSLYFTV